MFSLCENFSRVVRFPKKPRLGYRPRAYLIGCGLLMPASFDWMLTKALLTFDHMLRIRAHNKRTRSPLRPPHPSRMPPSNSAPFRLRNPASVCDVVNIASVWKICLKQVGHCQIELLHRLLLHKFMHERQSSGLENTSNLILMQDKSG